MKLLSRLWLFLSVLSLAPLSAEEDKRIADAQAVRELAGDGAVYTLYRLNPDQQKNEHSAKFFHGYRIVGKAGIDPADGRRLLDSLAESILEGKWIAACFDPGFGLSVKLGSQPAADMVICFRCLSMRAYHFHGGRGFVITDRPLKLFLEVARKAKLPEPPNLGEVVAVD